MKILLPSLINDGLFDFPANAGWKEIYQKYEDEGVDRNPIVHHLEDHGISHVQFWINHEQGQKSWADEHNVKYGEKSWYLDILEAQILHENPDVIYNTTLTVIPYDFIRKIKGLLKKQCLWVCFYGVKRTGEYRKFREYDLYLTGFRELESELRAENQKTIFFPHYFDDRYCDKNMNVKKEITFSFLGSLAYRYDDHTFNARRRLVERLMDEMGLRVFSHLTKELNCPRESLRQRWNALRWELYHLFNALPRPANFLSKAPILNKVKDWEVRPTPDFLFNARLTKRVQPPKYGEDLYNTLASSKLTLNVHGQVDANFGLARFAAGNIRLFEATGAGTCLLTDNLPHIEDFFEPDKEIVTYESPKEAKEKALFLINNPSECLEIQKCGQDRAWKDHSSSTRAMQFSQILKEHA
ncbi:glycosyltransferase [Verrucomicrobia bacterium]|nr:glycosyltransferase [Verrucomicrobiota bacterium]